MGLFSKSDGGKKAKVVGVDPADFLALRAELIDLKSRLEASEQERAVIEAHLSSLDASAIAFASTRTNIERINHKVEQLESQALAPAAATASTVANNEMLTAKVDALHQRLTSAPDLTPKIAELESMLNEVSAKVSSPLAPPPTSAAPAAPAGPDLSPKIAELEQLLSEMAAKVEAVPAQAAEAAEAAAIAAVASAGDSEGGNAGDRMGSAGEQPPTASLLGDMPSPAELELIGRLDDLQQRVATIDALHAQIDSLTSRIDQTSAETAAAAADAESAKAAAFSAHEAAQSAHDTAQSAHDTAATAHGSAQSARQTADSVAEQVALVAAIGRGAEAEAGRAEADANAQAALAALAEQASQLGQLAERVAATDAAARLATEQVGGIDQRLSNISTELANQISELGRDIDSLAGQPAAAASGITDETIEALRASQVKLAGEQARYEIAFREDLATLAEQIRRGTR